MLATRSAAAERLAQAEPNPWQFVFMALGAFLAYELGRGSGSRNRPRRRRASPSASRAMTDPSN